MTKKAFSSRLTCLEICAGAGGQALGLEQAGFHHVALVEIDKHAVQTLTLNRPEWNVLECDLHNFDAKPFFGVDLLSGGMPCPPFSVAGAQLGQADERDLFPQAIRLITECKPRAVMLENVKGMLEPKFNLYRQHITESIEALGYKVFWKLVNSSDFGVPQLRPRVVLIALQHKYASYFTWSHHAKSKSQTVGEVLYDEMARLGWEGASVWREKASSIAPTLVGGSKKHGGPDLGPTRSKRAWAMLGVNGHTIAENPPEQNFEGMPRLTVRMAARLQAFPDTWQFSGRKTSAYRQVGNAFPSSVACAIGKSIYQALQKAKNEKASKINKIYSGQNSLFESPLHIATD